MAAEVGSILFGHSGRWVYSSGHSMKRSSKTGTVPAERDGIVLISIHHAEKT